MPGGRDLEEVLERIGTVTGRSGPMTAEQFGEASSTRWGDGPPTDELVWAGPVIALLQSTARGGRVTLDQPGNRLARPH